MLLVSVKNCWCCIFVGWTRFFLLLLSFEFAYGEQVLFPAHNWFVVCFVSFFFAFFNAKSLALIYCWCFLHKITGIVFLSFGCVLYYCWFTFAFAYHVWVLCRVSLHVLWFCFLFSAFFAKICPNMMWREISRSPCPQIMNAYAPLCPPYPVLPVLYFSAPICTHSNPSAPINMFIYQCTHPHPFARIWIQIFIWKIEKNR